MDDNDTRELCKYGLLCYQKNAKHHEKYKHLPKPAKNTKKRPLEEATSSVEKTAKHEGPEKELTPQKPELASSSKTSNDMSTSSCKDLHNFIKDKFLIEMPKDFYEFWDFCKDLNEKKPQDALKDVGLTLVGPYDVLTNRFKDVSLSEDDYLRHWRYFYDPPEFQTILANVNTGYHIGYFRDEPYSEEHIVVSNDMKNCEITGLGDNIFAALNMHIEKYLKTCDPFSKLKIQKLQKTLISKYESQVNCTEFMKKRQKKIVTKTFHKMGLVVPFNRKTEVGYRDLIESDAALKKKLKFVSEADTPQELDSAMTLLQPIITSVNLATDECDFGTGIEFGLDLFCNGSKSLHKLILTLLVTGYDFINRKEYIKIIKAHLQDRRSGNNMSIFSNQC